MNTFYSWLCFGLAENDIEGSAQSALETLKVVQSMQSKKGEKQVRELYAELKRLSESNPYVCNLSVQLGMF